MNLNLPSDIEKKVDHILISLPFKGLSLKNLLKNIIPVEDDLILSGNAEKFRIVPGDSSIQFSQKESSSGIFWNFRFDFDFLENTKTNFSIINRFTNQKVVLFIGTSTHQYQLGYKDQPLDILFRETFTGYRVSITGDVYFPASRKQLVSFRSSF